MRVCKISVLWFTPICADLCARKAFSLRTISAMELNSVAFLLKLWGCSKMHRPHKAKRTKQISHFLRITAIKFKVEIFINENFSIKIALCYERNSPLDVPPYAFGQGGCAPSFRPFCTIFLKPPRLLQTR